MGMLAAFKSAMTTQVHAPAADMTIAHNGLKIAQSAQSALAKGDFANTRRMSAVLPAIQRPVTQTQANRLATTLGEVVKDAKMMAIVTPDIVNASKAWASAAQNRAKAATAVAGAGQAVAQMQAKAQGQIAEGQVKANWHVNIERAANHFSI